MADVSKKIILVLVTVLVLVLVAGTFSSLTASIKEEDQTPGATIGKVKLTVVRPPQPAIGQVRLVVEEPLNK